MTKNLVHGLTAGFELSEYKFRIDYGTHWNNKFKEFRNIDIVDVAIVILIVSDSENTGIGFGKR